MPQIPQYEQRTSAQGPLGPGPAGDRGFGLLARAGEELGNDALRLQQFEQQQTEEQAVVAANDELQASRSMWAEELEARKADAPAGAAGFTKQALEDFDKDAKDRIGRAKTQHARETLKERLTAVRLSIQGDAQDFERGSSERHKVEQLDSALNSARTAAEFRPADYNDILTEQSTAIAASGLSDEQRVAVFNRSIKDISSAAVMGMIRRDPYAANKELNNEKSKNPAVAALDFDDRQRLRNAAESEIRSREAEVKSKSVEARQAMDDQLRDIAVAASFGIPITNVPDEGVLKALYGDREGTQRYQAAQRAAELSGQVGEMNSLPSSELEKRAAAAVPKTVAGAADQAQLANFVASRTEQILRAREQDGAGYLVQHSAPVRDAWTKLAAAKTPEDQDAAREAYLSALRADRERLQIPGDAVLPNDFAASVADEINSAPSAEKQASILEQEGERWGEAWPQVYGQIVPKLGDTAAVIGSGIPRAAAVSLASVSGLKEAELKALLPVGTKWKDLQEKVDSEMEPLQRSLPADGVRTFNAFHESAMRLSAKYMNQGDSRSDAAAKAYRDLVTAQYEMPEFRGKPLRVPHGVDPDSVVDAADISVTNYAATSSDLVVPSNAALSPEEYTEQFSAYVRENGYWLTNPSGTGLRLYVDGGPVPKGKGVVELQWPQLIAVHELEEQKRWDKSRKEAAKRMEAR